MRQFDVVALGEVLIDFTPTAQTEAGELTFKRNPGGAPANALAAVVRLGGRAAFMGMVGAEDQFGAFLKDTLDQAGIDTRALKFTHKANTTLAFVTLDASGDRNFSFYRKPGADLMFSKEDIDVSLIKNSTFFHFGSLSMTNEPARSATLEAARIAKEEGCIISYDPNLRLPLWPSMAAAVEGMRLGVGYADILKVSEEEMEALTGETDLYKGSQLLFDQGPKLVLVTLGAKGCFYRFASGDGGADAVAPYTVRGVDATGCGDAMDGSVIYAFSRMAQPLARLDHDILQEVLGFANAVAGICVTRLGGIPAMPTLQEVEAFRSSTPRGPKAV
nr:PfkB family carbohydrate kinase [Maliibacterium massiliense]